MSAYAQNPFNCSCKEWDSLLNVQFGGFFGHHVYAILLHLINSHYLVTMFHWISLVMLWLLKARRPKHKCFSARTLNFKNVTFPSTALTFEPMLWLLEARLASILPIDAIVICDISAYYPYDLIPGLSICIIFSLTDEDWDGRQISWTPRHAGSSSSACTRYGHGYRQICQHSQSTE